MNYLLAKVKRKQNLFRVVSTDNEIYQLPATLGNSLDYNPATLLDEGEWYYINGFSGTPYSIDFIQNDFDSVNHNQITVNDMAKLSFLCAVQGDHYFFQIINSSQIVRKKWISINELTIEENRPIVTINTEADAIYIKSLDRLYFKKLSAANIMFNGLDQLYRNATDIEVQTFLANDFLTMINGFDETSVKIPNRKRIAIVTNTLAALSPQDRANIFAYIQGYVNVPFNAHRFEITTEDDLKFVIYGIEQRFYTTPLGNERRIANSIIPIP